MTPPDVAGCLPSKISLLSGHSHDLIIGVQQFMNI